MDIVIMNRTKSREESFKTVRPDTAIISITDRRLPFNTFHKAGWIKAVLYLKFDDVLADGPFGFCITDEDAAKIARFVQSVSDKVQRILVQCEAGISRSAGVAAAIMRVLNGDDMSIFKSPEYFPNMTCYRKVLEAFSWKVDEAELLERERLNQKIRFSW